MKRKVFLSMIIGVLGVFMITNPVLSAKFIGIATGSTGGTFYPVGVIFAKTFGEELADSGYQFSASASGGTAENLEMIRNHEIAMAIAGAIDTGDAYSGKDKYEGKAIQNVRFVSALFPQAIQLVYRKASGITKLADFAGKKIGVGPPAGGGSLYMPVILKTVAGLTFDDFEPQYLGYDDSVQAMQNRLIDACYLSAGLPTSGVSQLYASQIEVDMIEFTAEEVAKLQEAAPYFTSIVIPKETYPKQDRDLNVFGVKASLVADAAVEDDIIYKMLEVVYLKELASIQEQHGSLKTLTLEEALKGLSGAPLHPGAVKFYQDNGIDVPKHLLPPEK